MKNVLGIKFVEKVIEYEIMRHVELLKKGKKIPKETRRYDSINDRTISMRSKEQDPDYRFLSEPDIPVIDIDLREYEQVKSTLAQTPFQRKKKFSSQYQLDIADVQTMFAYDSMSVVFERQVSSGKRDPKDIFNW